MVVIVPIDKNNLSFWSKDSDIVRRWLYKYIYSLSYFMNMTELFKKRAILTSIKVMDDKNQASKVAKKEIEKTIVIFKVHKVFP